MVSKNEKIMLLITVAMFIVSVVFIEEGSKAITSKQELEQKINILRDKSIQRDIVLDTYIQHYNTLNEKYENKMMEDNKTKYIYYQNSRSFATECFDGGGVIYDTNNTTYMLNWSYYNSSKCTLIGQ